MQIVPELLRGPKRPVKKLVQSLTWLACLDWFSNSHSNDATEDAFDTFVSPTPSPPTPPPFSRAPFTMDELITDNIKYAQSVLVPESAPLSQQVAHDYFDCMRRAQLEPSQV